MSFQHIANILIDTGHPVTDKDALILSCNRAFKPDQYIHPGSELWLHPELRVGAVLAAAVGNPVVNNHDLAMISKIDTAIKEAQQRVSIAQRDSHLDPRILHALPVCGFDHRP